MSLKCGIVGLPNVGKSTLFNALTKAGIQAENYPFCTIEPNVGIVEVPDPRLAVLSEIVQPQRTVPAVMEFVDIAGLVEGASKGEGLGNQFLAHIRETDAIAHVVRCFEDPNVVHVAGRVDPAADIETIETELMLADLATLERRHERLRRSAKGNPEDAALLEVVEALREKLEAGVPARRSGIEAPATLGLITSKPVIYVCNVAEEDVATGNEHVERVRVGVGVSCGSPNPSHELNATPLKPTHASAMSSSARRQVLLGVILGWLAGGPQVQTATGNAPRPMAPEWTNQCTPGRPPPAARACSGRAGDRDRRPRAARPSARSWGRAPACG